MSDEKKPDYSKVKTNGGVTTTADGDTHPTGVTDATRAARVEALKAERAAMAGRLSNSDGDKVAQRRLGEIDRSLAAFGEKQERKPNTPPQKTVAPPAGPPAPSA